jgi:hypothetical protein
LIVIVSGGLPAARRGNASASRRAPLDRPNVGARVQAVGHEGPRDLGEDAAHVLVVGTQHRKPVERQIVQECDEALLEPREISVVRRQMIVVDVRDDAIIGCRCMNEASLSSASATR